MNATGVEARVCEDIAKRQARGIEKYGTTVEGNPLSLRDWLQHAYEESLDLPIYLKRAIEELDAKEKPIGAMVVERLGRFVDRLTEMRMDWEKVIESLLKRIVDASNSTDALDAACALEKVINAKALHDQLNTSPR